MLLSAGSDWIELDLRGAANLGEVANRISEVQLDGRNLSASVSATGLTIEYADGLSGTIAIKDAPGDAARFTGRQNLVAVVSNGTAVLGLGDIGPLASKPVMEGKAALFKKFAGVDCYDIEVAETDPEKLATIVAALPDSIARR